MRKVKTHSEWQRIFAWVNCGFITRLYRNAGQRAWRYEPISKARNQSWLHRTKKTSDAVSMKSQASQSRRSGRSWIFLQVNLRWDVRSKQWLYVEKEISLRKWAWPGSMCGKSVGNGKNHNAWYGGTSGISGRKQSQYGPDPSLWTVPVLPARDESRPPWTHHGRQPCFPRFDSAGKSLLQLIRMEQQGNGLSNIWKRRYFQPCGRTISWWWTICAPIMSKLSGKAWNRGHRGALSASLQSRFQPHWKMWSKLKSILRSWKIRTLDALSDAISRALSLISPLDCQHCFMVAIIQNVCKSFWKTNPSHTVIIKTAWHGFSYKKEHLCPAITIFHLLFIFSSDLE